MIDDDDDFGFSIVSEKELKKEQVTTQNKLEQLRKLIMPLLINLAKDGDKEIIRWPDRTKKINQVIDKINKLVDG